MSKNYYFVYFYGLMDLLSEVTGFMKANVGPIMCDKPPTAR